MLTFEDCLAFSDIGQTDRSQLHDLGTVPALRAACGDDTGGDGVEDRSPPQASRPVGVWGRIFRQR